MVVPPLAAIHHPVTVVPVHDRVGAVSRSKGTALTAKRHGRTSISGPVRIDEAFWAAMRHSVAMVAALAGKSLSIIIVHA